MNHIKDLGTTEFVLSKSYIEHGIASSCDNCPIALCLTDYVAELKYNHVTVFPNWVRFAEPVWSDDKYLDSYYHIYISTGVRDWLRKFDEGKAVVPIIMFLDVDVLACFHLQHEKKPYLCIDDIL